MAITIFSKKKREIIEENELLKEKISSLESQLKEKEELHEHLLDGIKSNLTEAFKQHSTVNNQHFSLKDLIGEIRQHFDQVEDVGNKLNDNADALFHNGNELMQFTETMSSKTAEGQTSIKEIQEIIGVMEKEIINTAHSIEDLSDRTKDIKGIVNVINDIANQTNLLALNASIEAARAGEHGSGFSVVAEEVRKLAESTAESTQSIEQLIQAMDEETNKTKNDHLASLEVMKNSISLSETTGASFSELTRAIEQVQLQITQVMDNIRSQEQYSNDITIEVNETRELFIEANDMILQHIRDAEEVDKELEIGLESVAE